MPVWQDVWGIPGPGGSGAAAAILRSSPRASRSGSVFCSGTMDDKTKCHGSGQYRGIIPGLCMRNRNEVTGEAWADGRGEQRCDLQRFWLIRPQKPWERWESVSVE